MLHELKHKLCHGGNCVVFLQLNCPPFMLGFHMNPTFLKYIYGSSGPPLCLGTTSLFHIKTGWSILCFPTKA